MEANTYIQVKPNSKLSILIFYTTTYFGVVNFYICRYNTEFVKRVGSLVAELNKLCDHYLIQKEEFKQKDKIRNTFTRIIKRGYSITTPFFDPMAPEYPLLSSCGKKDCIQLEYILRIKLIAIKNQN